MGAGRRVLQGCIVVCLAVLLEACSSGYSGSSSYEPPPKSPAERLYDVAVDYWPKYSPQPGHKSLACGFASDGDIQCNWIWGQSAIAAATAMALRDCTRETRAECFTFARDGCLSQWSEEVARKYGDPGGSCAPTLSDRELLYEAGMAHFTAYQEKPSPKARVCGFQEEHAKATCYVVWQALTLEIAIIDALKRCQEMVGRACFEFAVDEVLAGWAQEMSAQYGIARSAAEETTTAIYAGNVAREAAAALARTHYETSRTSYTPSDDEDDCDTSSSTDSLSGIAAGLSILNSMPNLNTSTQNFNTRQNFNYVPNYSTGQDMRSLSPSQATRREAPVMQYNRARSR
ncbi:MAG: hypothetical protein WDN25_02290 [Acetobacteraceae bacterium]